MGIYDIIKLLSTKERDFLIYNNGDQVKISSLNGKFVGLYFMHLPRDFEGATHPWSLVEAYNNLHPKGDFEVVLVALTEKDGDSDELFNKCFSKMPWLAIPFSDFETRSHLGAAFSVSSEYGPDCLLLDSSGKVISRYALAYFQCHTADWYPFTDIRLEDISEKEKEVRKEISLKNLLASPSRDYLIAKRGLKVPIDDLERKLVGIYFYDGRNHIKQELLAVYEKLKAENMDFEIVLINLYFNGGYRDEESFKQNLEEMPWLALPFGDTKCGKLWSIFKCPGYDFNDAGLLVIIRSGEFYEPYGMRIVLKYGIEAYPFTRKRAAELVIESRSLLPVFDAVGQKSVIQSDGTKIQVSNLKVKIIILLLASNLPDNLLSQLIRWYNVTKTKNKEFEVIYVPRCENKITFDKLFTEMPWLALSFGTGSKILDVLRWRKVPILVAFGQDGKLLTKNIRKCMALAEQGAEAYTFSFDDELVNETCIDIENDNFMFPLDP